MDYFLLIYRMNLECKNLKQLHTDPRIMIYLVCWKPQRNLAAAALTSCQSHSCVPQKVTHLTIFPTSDSSSFSGCNVKLSSPISRPYFAEKGSKNGKYLREIHAVAENKVSVCTMIEETSSKIRQGGLWSKFLVGSKKFRSVILLNVITVIYASNITVIKDVEAFTDPAYFCAIRFVLSTIPFLPFIFQARNDTQTRNSGLELGLWVSLGYLSEALGLLTSDAGRVSFISLFTVIVIPILESVLGAVIPVRTWFGVLMSVIGISMLECSGSPPNIGDLFSFLSAVFFGVHTLRTEHVSRTTKKENFLALLGYEVGVVAVLSVIWCAVAANFDGIQDIGNLLTWPSLWDWMCSFPWIPAFYTGIFSTGICLWGEIAAMREVSATETAVIYGLEPLWGAGFAWFLLGERWEVAGWIGAALILGGSLTVQLFGAEDAELGEASDRQKDGEMMMVSSSSKNMQKSLSASPVMAKSRNNVMDVFNR